MAGENEIIDLVKNKLVYGKLKKYWIMYLIVLYIFKNTDFLTNWCKSYIINKIWKVPKKLIKNESAIIIEGTTSELIINTICHMYIQNHSQKLIYQNKKYLPEIDQQLKKNNIEITVLGNTSVIKETNNIINQYNILKFEVKSNHLNSTEIYNYLEKQISEYKILINNSLPSICYFNQTKTKYNNIFVFDKTPFYSNKTFDKLYGKEILKIKEHIEFFINNEQWYKDRGMPYTLGIILYGPPGTGKTSLIKSIVNLTQRHLINLNLNNCSRDNLINLILNEKIECKCNQTYTIKHNQRILLLEDIDCMTDVVLDRKLFKKSRLNTSIYNNTETSQTFVLSDLLNVLDGVIETNGRIIIMTTNYYEYLDKALIRPGRIDIVANLAKCNIETLKEIINEYYQENIQDNLDIFDNKFTPAKVISLCLKNKTYKEVIQEMKILLQEKENILESLTIEEQIIYLLETNKTELKFNSKKSTFILNQIKLLIEEIESINDDIFQFYEYFDTMTQYNICKKINQLTISNAKYWVYYIDTIKYYYNIEPIIRDSDFWLNISSTRSLLDIAIKTCGLNLSNNFRYSVINEYLDDINTELNNASFCNLFYYKKENEKENEKENKKEKENKILEEYKNRNIC